MSLSHGVYSSEQATALIGVVESPSALPIVVGTAPIHTVPGANPSVDRLEKFTCWQDVLDIFGYVHDFDRYTLMEFLYAWFRLYGFAPVLCVNEFDPSAVVGEATITAVTLANNVGTLAVSGALVSAVCVDDEGVTDYVEGTYDDYTLAYDDNGYAVVTRLADGEIPTSSSIVYVEHQVIDVDRAGIDESAIVTGLEWIEQAYPQYGEVPSLIACPGYSQDSTAMVAMVGATEHGGGWYAYALTDVDSSSSGADALSEVAAWKSTNGYTDAGQDVLWPMVTIGNDTYHLSTIMACALAKSDHENGDMPYATGSNFPLPISGAVTEDGTSVWLTDEQANERLNAYGVTTAINDGPRGWITWGNRTGAYPGTTDPKDMWRNFRRMLVWLKNTVRLTLKQKVDEPGNLRQIESIINTLNIMLNGYAAQGALIGQPKVEFRRELNSTVDLLDGKYTFSISVCPPTAMESITLDWTIDVTQLETLFTEVA
jgi:hypothetical protein